MAKAQIPTAETLRNLLDYDPESGFLTWRPRAPELFHSDAIAKTWNIRFANKRAFTALRDGYFVGAVNYRTMGAHRVIWCHVHGTWAQEIDHINGDRSDNRIANLRSVTRSENMRNRGLSRANTSGVNGVHWSKDRECWVAQIGVGSKKVRTIGYFASLSDARAARLAAEVELDYGRLHGKRSIFER